MFVAGLVPTLGVAAGYGGAQGPNLIGEVMQFPVEEPETLIVHKNQQHSGWDKNRMNVDWNSEYIEYDMRAECPQFVANGGPYVGLVFSCPTKSGFPLSGATYEVILSDSWQVCSNSRRGTVYVCTQGCDDKQVVPIFYENPWEC